MATPLSTPAAAESPEELKHKDFDPEIYKHYAKVVDALSRNSVNAGTELAALYTNSDDSDSDSGSDGDDGIDYKLIRNLTGIAEPLVSCQLTLEDGTQYPPPQDSGGARYDLYLTYNELALAPRVRVECVFRRYVDSRSKKSPKMAIEFHFSRCGDSQLKNFERDGNVIRFEANGATVSGFSAIAQNKHRLGQPEQDIVELFDKLTWYSPAWNMSFKLATDALSNYQSHMLSQTYRRLPGGSGPELPSLKHPEYSSFGVYEHGITLAPDAMRSPHNLMEGKVPNLMVPLDCDDTFTSIEEASVQLGHSAFVSNVECRAALELWAGVLHSGKLYEFEGFPVLGVNFRPFRKLGGVRDEVKYRLPRELFAKMQLSTHSGDATKFEGYLESEALDLPAHHAFFVITSRNLAWFEHELNMKPETERLIRFQPHYNSFTYNSQIQTINELYRATEWHPHLLNQRSDELEDVDLTADISRSKVAEADKWLWGCRKWNREQRKVLKQIHKAKGKMVITMGIAGTGKTLLQSALAAYFAMLGFQCLICTPANSNADHSAKLLRSFTKKGEKIEPHEGGDSHVSDQTQSGNHDDDADSAYFTASSNQEDNNDGGGLRVHRLYPSSRNIGFKEMSQDQAQHRKVGHLDGAVSSIHGLEFKLKKFKDRKVGVRDLAIEQGVLDEADNGVLHYVKQIDTKQGPIDVWDRFRQLLDLSREHNFRWDNHKLVEEYSKVYEACNGHLIALTNIIVTTTGNARCSELIEHWKHAAEDYGLYYKGVIVFLDEAPKDVEINTWMPIIMPGAQTKGVFMFGDDKQLSPTNTCSSGKLNFNIYNKRSDLALPIRFINASLPHISLREQLRMHPCISEFANEEFYGGKLRDGPKVNVKLEDVKPGLTEVLHKIIAKSFTSTYDANNYVRRAKDEQARHHFLEVRGWVHVNEESGSRLVTEHINLFFKNVFPDLQAYFKDKTKENLMIICAYGWALGKYKDRFLKLQKEQKLPASYYPVVVEQSDLGDGSNRQPQESTNNTEAATTTKEDAKDAKAIDRAFFDPRVTTIDSAQGQESFMVVMDGSFQYRDWMGFMTDRGRCNVAMTRAKGVFWMIGGPLGLKHSENAGEPLSPFPKLKKEMEMKGRVHRFGV